MSPRAVGLTHVFLIEILAEIELATRVESRRLGSFLSGGF
jgi:hypothetical protein